MTGMVVDRSGRARSGEQSMGMVRARKRRYGSGVVRFGTAEQAKLVPGMVADPKTIYSLGVLYFKM
jgi:hypothetical protein